MLDLRFGGGAARAADVSIGLWVLCVVHLDHAFLIRHASHNHTSRIILGSGDVRSQWRASQWL